MVKLGLAKSILDAEATLYANAPKLADEWVDENKRLFAKLIKQRDEKKRLRAEKAKTNAGKAATSSKAQR